jgi:hypothetical protein
MLPTRFRGHMVSGADVARRNLRGVVSGSVRRTETWGQRQSERWLERRLAGCAGLDALYGVRLFRLCLCEFHALHGEVSQRRQWGKSASGGLERILRTLDVVLLGCVCDFVFCCSYRGYKPTLSQRSLISVGPGRWSGQSRKELVLAEPFQHPETERLATEVSRYGSGVLLERRSSAWLQAPCAEPWLTVGATQLIPFGRVSSIAQLGRCL